MRDSLNEYFSKHLFATVESLQITEDDLPDARRPCWFPWCRMVGWCMVIVGWLVVFSFCKFVNGLCLGFQIDFNPALRFFLSFVWDAFLGALVYSLQLELFFQWRTASAARIAHLGLYPYNPHSCYKQAEHHQNVEGERYWEKSKVDRCGSWKISKKGFFWCRR